MNIYAEVSFQSFNCEDSPPNIQAVPIYCKLTQRGLKYVWEEIPGVDDNPDFINENIKCYLKTDFKMTNKDYWIDEGIGLIKIPFFEEHFMQLKEIEE